MQFRLAILLNNFELQFYRVNLWLLQFYSYELQFYCIILDCNFALTITVTIKLHYKIAPTIKLLLENCTKKLQPKNCTIKLQLKSNLTTYKIVIKIAT